MGYFDGLTEASFKKNKEGLTLYYPWGSFGKGYVVADDERAKTLRRFTKLNYLIVLPVVMLIQGFFGPAANIIVLPIYIVIFIALLKKFTADLPIASERLSTAESFRNSAEHHSLLTLVVLDVVAILFVAVGFLFIIEGQNWLLGLFAVALFGFTAAAASYMVWSKLKHK